MGAVCGWVATLVMPAPGFASRVESVLVAVFGAFIGGEFVSSQLASAPAPGAAAAAFKMSSLGLAVAGAVVMLMLLSVMRKAVGPLRPHKIRRKQRP